MALPTLVKTWQFSINNFVNTQVDATTMLHEYFRVVKNLLLGFGTLPWTCSGSSDARTGPAGAAGMDGVDRWTSASVMEGAAPGSRHGWIVLRQTGIATNYEYCIDLNINSTTSAGIFVSPAAGFTGGSATARPTATDEITITTGSTVLDGLNFPYVIHAMQSTDGECTRVCVQKAGTAQAVFWLMDKPKNPVTGWATPSVTTYVQSSSLIGQATNYSNLLAAASSGTKTRAATILVPLLWSGEGTGYTGSNGIYANVQEIGTRKNDISGLYSFFRIGLASTTATAKGKLGELFDLWWKPNCVLFGDSFPEAAATINFVALGCLIHPWTGLTVPPRLG